MPSFRLAALFAAALAAAAPRLAAQAAPGQAEPGQAEPPAESEPGAAGYRASFGSTGPADVDAAAYPRESYAGRDTLGVPHYVERPFSDEERRLLREQFGIEDPGRLYLRDSTAGAYLDYDTERDPGATRLVRTYRVGAPSIRRPGETWETLERRLRTMRPSDFPASARVADTTLASLAPAARPHFARMLRAARRAGHRVRVTEAYRSPERQAYLLVRGGGQTFTATSLHSAGHALDVVVGDGNLRHRRTRARWIAFRRWLSGYEGGRFRIVGTPRKSWDWPHVELAEGVSGYHSVEELLQAARAADGACCTPSGPVLHWSNDPARRGTAPLPRPRGDRLPLRLDDSTGGAALPAR